MAPIQPWSAAGAEKPMTTSSPGSSFSVVVTGPVAAASSSRGSLLTQPVTTSAAQAAAMKAPETLRVRTAVDEVMVISLDLG
jgi:hypothetical protein